MSEPTRPRVFVCGATGSQGGALAHQLRALNWTVHATVRNVNSAAAQSLQAAGVRINQGNWDEPTTFSSALAGCDKLFLCLLPDFSDPTRELRHADAIIKTAKAAGVIQVIASTSLGVFTLEQNPEHVQPGSFMATHLANKKGIEDTVRNGGFEHFTFLRPSFFMANFLEPKVARYPEPRDKGSWTTAMTPDAPLALIDHVDIAAFAVEIFKDPARFHQRAIGLASEMLTVPETLDLLGRAANRAIEAKFLTDEEISERRKGSNVFTDSQVSMRYMAKYIDMHEIKDVINPTRFEEFLEREREGVRETYK